MKLDDAAARLEALGNPTRLKIYRALIRAGGAGLAVGRLQEKLKIAPSTLSHHIKALVVVGLVTQERDATTRPDWREELFSYSSGGVVPTIVEAGGEVTIGLDGHG